MVHTVDDYLLSLQGPAREWVGEYVRFMRSRYPNVTEGIAYQVPAYKIGNACISFSASKHHFIFQTLDGEWLARLKSRLPEARFGKDSLKIPFEDTEAKEAIYEACEGILAAERVTAGQRAM